MDSIESYIADLSTYEIYNNDPTKLEDKFHCITREGFDNKIEQLEYEGHKVLIMEEGI